MGHYATPLVNPNSKDDKGNSVFHLAVKARNPSLLFFLITMVRQQDSKRSQRDKFSRTNASRVFSQGPKVITELNDDLESPFSLAMGMVAADHAKHAVSRNNTSSVRENPKLDAQARQIQCQ